MENGKIGMNFPIGLYYKTVDHITQDEPDLFQQVKEAGKDFAPYGRRINDVDNLENLLQEIGFKEIKTGRISKKMSIDEMRAFYSIPAQSAARWPKTAYKNRLKLLDNIIEYFKESGIESFYQQWGWIIAEK
jgi:hypothetical protein